MTSLARSLLALAVVALLQAAYAQFHGESPGQLRSDHHGRIIPQKCTTVMFGRSSVHPDWTYDLPPIHITYAYNDVQINDPREYNMGSVVVGQEVTVCNRHGTRAPRVTQRTPDSFDVVKVTLGFGVQPPIDMVMYVTRFFEEVVRPPPSSESSSDGDDDYSSHISQYE